MSKKITKLALTRLSTSIGGVEIYSVNFVRAMRRFFPGLEVYFLTNLPLLAKKVENVGGRVYILPVFAEEVGTKRGLMRLAFYLPKYLFYFLKNIFILQKKEKINLICFQGTTEKIVLTPLLKFFGFRVVWLEHGPFFTVTKAREVGFLYKFTSQMVDKIITVSQQSKQNLIENKIEARKVVYVPTGVDTDFFSPRKKASRQLIVGYVGAICQEKGVDEFIRVGRLIIKKLKSVKCVLVGDGPLIKPEKNFLFTGFQEDIRPYLGDFDVFFFPTWHQEGLSAAVIQAMAMGVPVVARDIGGNRELVVHGKTGYLFKNETPEELADVIVDLLKDKKKRKAMGKAARERIVKHFNMEKWVTELYSVFEEVARK